MKRRNLLHLLYLLPLLLAVGGCTSDEELLTPAEEITPGTLLSAELIGTSSATELAAFIAFAGVSLPEGAIAYDVATYRVEYATTYKGAQIIASGLVILPERDSPLSMIGFQHGTIAALDEAPSVLPPGNIERILYQALAATGIITVVPDLIGYGSSSQYVHPYYVEELTASAAYDNLLAAQTLAQDEARTFDNDLFLAGYSQGGYSAMATHKYIESEGLQDFRLVATLSAAGGYDLKHFQEYVFEQETYEQPFYLALLSYGYQQTYEFSEGLDLIFRERYASQIPVLLDGRLSGQEINAQLSTSIPDLLQPDILQNLDTDPRYSFVADPLRENSLTDWVPVAPLYIYHGDADDWVPYQNSVLTYERLLENGASPDNLSLTTLPGADHETGLFAYAEQFLPVLLALD